MVTKCLLPVRLAVENIYIEELNILYKFYLDFSLIKPYMGG